VCILQSNEAPKGRMTPNDPDRGDQCRSPPIERQSTSLRSLPISLLTTRSMHQDLRRFLVWGALNLGYPELARVEAAPPTAELEPLREGMVQQVRRGAYF